ncbi:uncharacterized protein LOC124350957 [Daphnia pulicaria]|uniref:uncharacterized protein LOC124350957 n=1 Tax=Daphnia pulicaria TaxID=35523 RepID=UPI001EEA54A7|nr:uncharacterized protein LOC124350957 [Daphnia pulicaria]
MVEVIRLNDQKFYKQRLFGFLTKFTSTSCTIKTLKLNGRYRATLTVFGEEESYIGEQSNRRAAEINACIRYINQNVVNQEMTWSFAPGHRFLELKNRISTGLELYGNYHPQVVVRELERWYPDLKWDIFPKGKAESYSCNLQIRPYGSVYVVEETGNTKMEANISSFMKMAKKLFDIGDLPPYSPDNMVEDMELRPVLLYRPAVLKVLHSRAGISTK